MSADVFVTFMDRLKESHLLRPEQLDKIKRRPEASARDVRGLANYLCHKGWLTAFQVQELAKKRGQRLVLGPYRLLDKIGEGGMGQVYKAQHDVMNRVVAFKVIADDHLRDPRRVQRFYQEIRLAAKLAHPNIVTAYDAGKVDNTHFFAMEYVEGTDLARLVREHGPLPVPQACDFIRQAARGLQHAHEQGMIHRDIKPSNLIVARGGREPVVKVLDMGLARLQSFGDGEAEITRDGMVVGSPSYLAPEQGRDPHNIDSRADLYSLGCSLYYLLKARVPFNGSSPLEIMLKHQADPPPKLSDARSEAPPALDAVITKLLAKDPADRYQSARAVVDALAPFCRKGLKGGDTSSAVTVECTKTKRPRRVRPEIPRPVVVALAGGGALLVIGFIALVVALSGKAETTESSANRGSQGAGKASTSPAARKPEEEAVYTAMKLVEVKMLGGPYHTGDTVRFQIRMFNSAGRPIDALHMEKSNTKYGIGMAQFWIERLGNDDRIPAIAANLSKVGRKYAAGGVPFESLARVAAGDEVVLDRELQTDYRGDKFPPAKYRYYFEYRSQDNKVSYQFGQLEFELLP